MKGHLRIICATKMVKQATKQRTALLGKLNLKLYALQNPEPYRKVSGQCVINCDFGAETVDTDVLAEELCALSGAQRPEVVRTERECEIGCYNSVPAMKKIRRCSLSTAIWFYNYFGYHARNHLDNRCSWFT